jgi:hypothetical protein
MTNKRILVFDDDPRNLDVARQAYAHLDNYGFQTDTTRLPGVALRKIEKRECDIIVSDLMCEDKFVSNKIFDLMRKQLDFAKKHFEINPQDKSWKEESYRYNAGRVYTFRHKEWPKEITFVSDNPFYIPGGQMYYPVGTVLFEEALKRGIEANIATDTHRHSLSSSTDIRELTLPLLIKYPSLAVRLDNGLGYFDESKIRTNVEKDKQKSWLYGSGYTNKIASFLPWANLTGSEAESKIEEILGEAK